MLNKKGKFSENKQAMTIIEVMIAIFIFTLGIASVFMIISSAGNLNSYNKNFIIASNLAREQIELIRNIRDTNYKKFQKWNMLEPGGTNYLKVFKEGSFYKIENGSGVGGFHIKSSSGAIIANFKNALKNKIDTSEEDYRLCLENNKYIYCKWKGVEVSTKKTNFYKYIDIQKIKKADGSFIDDSFKINSVVYWNLKGIHKVEIPTILADYKRL